jgi:hypothetical protein
MKKIMVQEEVRIPDSLIILEAGDVIFIKESDDGPNILEFESDDGTVVQLKKRGGDWVEAKVIKGDKPYGWGGKTYAGYLTAKDIAKYLHDDYDMRWTEVD